MSNPTFNSFDEFWPFYVREHSKKANRTIHFIGTSSAFAVLATALLTKRPALALAAPLLGYGGAWIGHFFIEGNKPASFGHPLWSFRGDMRMWSMIAAGTMDAEVERVMSASSSNGFHADVAAPAEEAVAPNPAAN